MMFPPYYPVPNDGHLTNPQHAPGPRAHKGRGGPHWEYNGHTTMAPHWVCPALLNPHPDHRCEQQRFKPGPKGVRCAYCRDAFRFRRTRARKRADKQEQRENAAYDALAKRRVDWRPGVRGKKDEVGGQCCVVM